MPQTRNGLRRKVKTIFLALPWITKFIKESAKLLGSFTIIIGIIYIFFYSFLTDDIFINDMILEGEAAGRGFSGATLLERAIVLRPHVSRMRFENVSAIRFLSQVARSSEEFEGSTFCNLNISLSSNQAFFQEMRRAVMSSKAIDNIVTADKVSIRKIAFQVRQFWHKSAREVTPFLSSIDKNMFLTMHVSPSSIRDQKIKIENPENSEEIAEELAHYLADMIAPELAAFELATFGGKGFPRHFEVAKEFLDDRHKTGLVSYLWLIAVLQDTTNISSSEYKFIAAEKAISNIERMLDFDRLGENGIMIRVAIAEVRARGHVARSFLEGKQSDSKEVFKKFIGSFVEDLKSSFKGRVKLGHLYILAGMKEEYLDHIEKLLQNNTKVAGAVGFGIEAVVSYALAMLEQGEIVEARNLLRSENVKSIYNASLQDSELVNSTQAYLAINALIDLDDGNHDNLKSMEESQYGGSVCANFITTSLANSLYKSDFLKNSDKSFVLSLLVAGFDRMEKGGLASYEFYSQWARMLFSLYGYEVASPKFERALQFEGPHDWGLLNWGWAAIAADKLDIAKEKFGKSLELSAVPLAIVGMLEVLARQNNDSEFLDGFHKYGGYIRGQDEQTRGRFEAWAMITSCRSRKTLKKSVLDSREKLYIGIIETTKEKFREDKCDFVSD